ncbi:hypothetical protein, partial [Bibersteinia trehalosi]|uniref:hypothetical protein n=1 Tax=Bibersteinia trehalosi TaxID=47735 RepID=UPI00163AA9A3
LGKLPWWQQSLYGTAIDYGYEVNKSNATPQSVKVEMIGSYAGTGVSGLVELGTMAVPKFSGASKIFGSTIFSDIASDNAKAVYGELEKQNKDKGSEK